MENSRKILAVKALIIMVMLGSMLYFRGADSASVSVASSIIAAVVMISFIRWRHPEAYKKDERVNKLAAYAASWSWFVTFIFVAVIYWVDYLGLVTLGLEEAVSAIFFVMVVTIIGFRFYFLRKGDA